MKEPMLTCFTEAYKALARTRRYVDTLSPAAAELRELERWLSTIDRRVREAQESGVPA